MLPRPRICSARERAGGEGTQPSPARGKSCTLTLTLRLPTLKRCAGEDKTRVLSLNWVAGVNPRFEQAKKTLCALQAEPPC